ncbi:DUF4105 domain-containing protein [Flavobacterium sp. ST-75]|uniref:DUF4105 domain-containing protein n=1 Tax=Flavobacterium rhizophilum TaxID=3163296 RepID=A0ABW8Y9K1_9FLAO
MQSFRALLILLFFSLSTFKTFAQIPLSDKAEISVLTCGSGNELYSVFGHTAIRVFDPAKNINTVYNFGTFDFDTPNFYPKFVKGDLQYFVSVASYRDFIYEYQYYGRDVYEQILNLTHYQKQKIADELNGILFSDKKYYTYKFIDRNCTTMVADIVNKQVTISLENSDRGKTYREIIYSYLQDNHFYENLGVNLLFGYKTDNTSGKLFLPKELMEGIGNTNIKNGQPLVKLKKTIVGKTEQTTSFSFLNSFYSYLLLILGLLILTTKKAGYNTYLVFAGLMGLLFCFVSLYSSHNELLLNYNILLFNPLFLLIAITSPKKRKTLLKRLIHASFFLFAVYLILIITKVHIWLMLPLLLVNSVALIRKIKTIPTIN